MAVRAYLPVSARVYLNLPRFQPDYRLMIDKQQSQGVHYLVGSTGIVPH